jgi:hypothetical protein
MDTNGNVKWWHLIPIILGIITIGVTITICVTGALSSAIEKVDIKTEKNESCYHLIDLRLSRIEAKLDIKQ